MISNPNSFEIIHDGFNGGLGHKFISIYHSLSYAIVTGRRFYRLSHHIYSSVVNIAPSIWNVTSSCFIDHRYVDQVTTHAIYPNHTRLTNKECYEGCIRKRSNEMCEGENTIEGILGDGNVVLYDCRMNHPIIHSPFTLQTLKNHQILSFNQSIPDYQQIIYRLLLNLLAHITQSFLAFQIDDHEIVNVEKICNEIFGESNRIATICHKSRASISNDKIVSSNHNFIAFYAKNITIIEQNRKLIGVDPVLDNFNYDDNDGKGEYRLVPVDGPGGEKKGIHFMNFCDTLFFIFF